MSESDVATGARQPLRQRKPAPPAIGAIVAGLSVPLVFASGYLTGWSTADPSSAATAVESSRQARAELPASSDAPAPANRSEDSQTTDSRPSRLTVERSITVREGDSLWEIAAAVAPQADRPAIVRRIVALNSLDDSAELQIGQRLVVPVANNGSTRRRLR